MFAALGGRVDLASVCEVGCGAGGVLAAALRAGAQRVVGIERFAPPAASLLLPEASLRIADYLAADGLDPAVLAGEGPHGLVVCLGIAQLVPPQALPGFLDALLAAGEAVLFSVPIPGQGGDPAAPGLFLGEVQRVFGKRGCWMDDFFRPLAWADRQVPLWARQGLVLFRRGAPPADGVPTAVPVSAVHEHAYGRLLAKAAALAAENQALLLTLAVPIRRLMALDAALLAEDVALADRVAALLEPSLRQAGVRLHAVALCMANELMSAAFHLLAPALADAAPGRVALRDGAVAAEAIGRPDLAWDLLARAGRTARPSEALVQHALRLGRRDWLEPVLKGAAAEAGLARFAPFLDLPARDARAAPPVFVVNLPTDRYRRRRAERNLADLGLEARFRRGFRPMEIPAEGRALFRGVRFDAATDGSFGNQYSQYLVWREIAEGREPCALVLEDDALLLADPGAVLATLELPVGWDVIFATPRLDMTARLLPPQGRFVLTPFAEAFARHSHAAPAQSGFGSECVFISREGARKLVAIVEAEGFHSVGTDWYLQSHCVPQTPAGAFNRDSRVWEQVSGRFDCRAAGAPLLEGHVLSPALAQTFSRGMHRALRI